jgi:hypothetical protein
MVNLIGNVIVAMFGILLAPVAAALVVPKCGKKPNAYHMLVAATI